MKKILFFLIITFAVALSRNYWFSILFKYEITGERKAREIENQNIKDYFKNEKANDIEEIIQNALKKTSSDLSFTFDKCENEPEKLIKTKKANCIGYSAFLALAIQSMLNSKGMSDQWKVKHEIGEIYFLNKNINKYFSSKFFQDHDFVTIENTETKEIITIDGTLYDYFKIDKVKLK